MRAPALRLLPLRLFLLFGVPIAAGCEPMATSFPDREDVPVRVRSALVPAPENPDQLKVVAWNVKYAAGRIDFWFDLWGDRTEMTREEVDENLAALTALLNEVKPDVFLTSEIELGSRRSAYVDMIARILEDTDLNYAAFYPNWQSRWVPSEGVGRMLMGNAIFSRYPIVEAQRIAQQDRTDQPPHVKYFYLHRNVGRAVVDVGHKQVAVFTVHTEAYDQDGTKSRQLVELLDLLAAEERPFLVGGDFNAIPPNAVRTSDFADDHPDAVGTDFETPPYVPADMQPFFDRFASAITLEQMGDTEASQRRYYTHSIIGPDKVGRDGLPGFWTRTLDYLFVEAPDRFLPGSTVLQQRGDDGIESDPLLLSDHAPVVGTWELVR